MHIKYDIHTIHWVYLTEKKKIIYNKDLKIVENADEKKSSDYILYWYYSISRWQ